MMIEDRRDQIADLRSDLCDLRSIFFCLKLVLNLQPHFKTNNPNQDWHNMNS